MPSLLTHGRAWAILLGISLASSAGAVTIELRQNFNASSTLNPSGSFTQTFTIHKFDPAMGTLVSARLDLTMQVAGMATFTSLISGPQQTPWCNYSASESWDSIASGQTFSASDITIGHILYSGSADTTGSAFREATLYPALDSLIGTGDITLTASGSGSIAPAFNVSGSARLDRSSVSVANYGSISYQYIPIPEPSTLSLLALGPAALFRRPRRTPAQPL